MAITLKEWRCSPYTVSLQKDGDNYKAIASRKKSEPVTFEAKQIVCGITGDSSIKQIAEKINAVASYVFTKDDPREVWLFEGTSKNFREIAAGKKLLNKANSSIEIANAISRFTTALKIAKKVPKSVTEELEEAISDLKRTEFFLRMKENAILLLPEDTNKKFLEIINDYEEDEDFVELLTDVSENANSAPEITFLLALLSEEKEDYQGAFNLYLKLAKEEMAANTAACLKQAYLLLQKVNQSSDIQDAVRMTFEQHLRALSEMSTQTESPTAFICFNLDKEDDDIHAWLQNSLVPDLDQVGIKPQFCLRDLRKAGSLTGFESLARSADLVLVACTPGLKAKCERTALVGAGYEAELINARVNDAEKIGTTYPIYLKGSRKESLPQKLIIYENTLGEKLPIVHASGFSYFCQAFDLFAAMKGVPREEGQNLRDAFLSETIKILEWNFDQDQVTTWRSNRKTDLSKVLKAAKERVTNEAEFANLPLPEMHFTGRKDELEKLHELCQNNHRTALSGLGGIGKTALAICYANKYKSYYKFVHYILGTSSQLISQGLLELADHLQVPKSDKPEERLLWLKNTLMNFKGKYLLFFDGVDQEEVLDELERHLPSQASCLLVTTRLTKKADHLKYKKMHLDVLSTKDAIDFLINATGHSDQKAAEELAKELGYLPLALTHAAGYIVNHEISMEVYQAFFKDEKWELFKEEWLYRLPEGEFTIHKTWQISIAAIEEKCPSAVELFRFFSLLAHAPISLSLMKEWYKTFFPDSSQLEAMDAIGYLIKYSFIEKAPQNCYSIHALVQKITKNQLSSEEKELHYNNALKAMLDLFHYGDYKTKATRLVLKYNETHAEIILNNIKISCSCSDSYNNFLRLSNCIEKYYFFNGNHHGALTSTERLLIVNKKLFNYESMEIAVNLNSLGHFLARLNRHEESLEYYKEALRIVKSLKGQNEILSKVVDEKEK